MRHIWLAIVCVAGWVALTAGLVQTDRPITVANVVSDLTSGFGLALVLWALLGYAGALNPRRSVGRRSALLALLLGVVGLAVLAYSLDTSGSSLWLLSLVGLPGLPLGFAAATAIAGPYLHWDRGNWAVYLSVGVSPWMWHGVLWWLGRNFAGFRRSVLLLRTERSASISGAA